MEAEKIEENIYWVGAIDYNVREFHGYTTPKGSTYNAYLIVDEKTVLIDTVKSPFKKELLERIGSVADPEGIDYLVVNHVEMDHSSSATEVMNLNPDAQVICTEKGKEFLHAHYDSSASWSIQTVGAEDSVSIGKRTLRFVPAPMLHWPDTMFTYSPYDKVLFSNDGFGQHIATSQRFADEVRTMDVFGDAKKYYANILMPFSSIAKKKLDELKGFELVVVCPSHGVIFREADDISKIISLYKDWAVGTVKDKAVIVYDTMYKSTERMARSIEEGLNKEGVETRFYNLRVSDWSAIIDEVLDAKAVIVGSSTLNNGPLPTISGFLSYLKGLRPRGKIGAAFGSFGWGGGAVKAISENLKSGGLNLPEEGLQIKFVPTPEVLNSCYEFGRTLATHIRR